MQERLIFKNCKISDFGTNNFIVARLATQTNELTQYFGLTEEQQQRIYEILGVKVCERLLECYKIHDSLNKEVQSILNDISEGKKYFILKNNSYDIPFIIDLNMRCENFLYQAKSALRDLCQLFDIFQNERFAEARYDKVYDWAKSKFGENDMLTEYIKDNHDSWIRMFVSMRNAIEHPGGYSGYLHINNFIINESERTIKTPSWRLNEGDDSSVVNDMDVFINNMVIFSEELLTMLLMKVGANIPIRFYEIPENERDENKPMRIGITIDPSILKFNEVEGK